MTAYVPPSRTITRKTATVIDQDGYYVDDGMDVPGYEYAEVKILGSREVIRVSIKCEENDYDEKNSTFNRFGWLTGDR